MVFLPAQHVPTREMTRDRVRVCLIERNPPRQAVILMLEPKVLKLKVLKDTPDDDREVHQEVEMSLGRLFQGLLRTVC